MLFIANYPRMGQYMMPLTDQEVKMPDIAFGFINGEELN